MMMMMMMMVVGGDVLSEQLGLPHGVYLAGALGRCLHTPQGQAHLYPVQVRRSKCSFHKNNLFIRTRLAVLLTSVLALGMQFTILQNFP